MFACVTSGFTTPGVHRASGRAFADRHELAARRAAAALGVEEGAPLAVGDSAFVACEPATGATPAQPAMAAQRTNAITACRITHRFPGPPCPPQRQAYAEVTNS